MTRIKESLFSIIDDRIEGATVLDLFAGSGALGIECISRGAQKTFLVDSSPEAIKVIKKNTERMQNFEVIQKDFMQALKFFSGKQKFDMVFLDPPYDSQMGEQAIDFIFKNNLLADDGIIIFEHTSKKCLPSDSELFIITRSKNYGEKVIDIIAKKD